MDNSGDKNIKKVLILGAGTMGLQIGIQCAASGFEVMVYDPFDAALEAAQKRLDGLAGKLASANRITAEQAQMALIRMQFSSDPEIAGKMRTSSANPCLKIRNSKPEFLRSSIKFARLIRFLPPIPPP